MTQPWSPVVPRWTVAASTPSWSQAAVEWIQVEDPTGNVGSYASPGEPVWRIRAALNRKRWQDFERSELLVITNHLSVPGPGEMIPLDGVAEAGGTRLTLWALCGPGRLSITNGTARGMSPPDSGPGSSGMFARGSTVRGSTVVEYWSCPDPFLFLEAEGLTERDRVQFRGFEGEGKELAWRNPHGGPSTARQGGRRVYVLDFEGQTNGVITRFEAVVSRALEFEFNLRPPGQGPPQ